MGEIDDTRIEGVDTRVVDLGAVIAGVRAHTLVLYQAGSRRYAQGVARALHAGPAHAMSGGPATFLGQVTQVAVLLGRDTKAADVR
jgi:hypothetical protein